MLHKLFKRCHPQQHCKTLFHLCRFVFNHVINEMFDIKLNSVTIQTINLSVPGSQIKEKMNGRGRHLEQKI